MFLKNACSKRGATGLMFFLSLHTTISFAEHPSEKTAVLETIVVTGNRESSSLANTAASVGVIDEAEVQSVNPTHAAELLNRIPGVNIVQLGSSADGAAAAIRQPISYSPVYLYLENGVPTRSAGFFNHNALYGMNVGTANGIEVIKGPGSALYGSDAIGAVINLISGRPPTKNSASIGIEVGENGWRKLQLRGSAITEEHGFTARAEVKTYNGWREHTKGDRQSFTGSWNTTLGDDITVNTVFSASDLEYDTGGSGLSYDDYKNDSEKPGNLIAFRKASAYRLSSAFELALDSGTLSVTPFLRSNTLEYMAHWTLNTGKETCGYAPPPCANQTIDSPDAHINDSGHDSVGILLKYHYDINPNSFVITGVDLDYSRGVVEQTYIERTDNDPGDYWLAYNETRTIYDFDIDFYSISPYVHFETQFTETLRFSAGLRYDDIHYDYDSNLTVDIEDATHKRLPSQSVDMNHLSPKLGLIYQITSDLNAYASYRHAFRVPSSSQLFRSGKTVDSSNLDPVIVDSFELGLRGNITPSIGFEAAAFTMTKKDDILTVNDSDGRRNVNAGETEHYGIELGFDIQASDNIDILLAYTRTEHRFVDWEDGKNDYSGNDIPLAPKAFGNVRLQYHPYWLNSGKFEVEWLHQREHWIDYANGDSTKDRTTYSGHNLLNLRADYWITNQLNLYIRVLNATNKLYAETTNEYGKYVPGRPRSAYTGFRFEF